MGWWYDTLSVDVGLMFNLPFGLFSSYDYATEDDGAIPAVKTHPGFEWGPNHENMMEYELESVYVRSFGPSLGGSYGVNTCDAYQEESLGTNHALYSPDEPIVIIDDTEEIIEDAEI